MFKCIRTVAIEGLGNVGRLGDGLAHGEAWRQTHMQHGEHTGPGATRVGEGRCGEVEADACERRKIMVWFNWEVQRITALHLNYFAYRPLYISNMDSMHD